MIYITHIRLAGGSRHEHISDFKWSEVGTGNTGTMTRAQLVDWIRGGGDARVRATPTDVKVEVVNATPPYVRTVANGAYTDNLLALPHF